LSLQNLSDERLIADTKMWNEKEEYSTRQFLRHINEVNRRRLYCDDKTGSLFKYIRKNFNKSDSEASRRILAAKTLRLVPNADKALAKKQVTLTSLAEVSSLVDGIKSNKKKNEILSSIVGKTQTQTRELVEKLTGKKRATRPQTRSHSDGSLRIHLTLVGQTAKDYQFIKEQLSNKGLYSTEDIIGHAITETADSIRKKIAGIGSRKSKVITNTRTISAAIKRSVMTRSGNKCENCSSKYNLHFDHVIPYSVSKSSAIGNVRQLCSNCNNRAAIMTLSQEKMDLYINKS
ncbi:MAG: HNH endonuclease, partial [Bacteriovoracaceae bacterium]|nr:HNH endonuclease [Bacteriovoracaceae bacterium]